VKRTNVDYTMPITIGISIALIGGAVLFFIKKSKDRINYAVFDSPDIPGSGKCIDKELVGKLKKLEKLTGYPIFEKINSGARSPKHNKSVGGVSNSAHLMPKCKAVDISTKGRTTKETNAIRDKLVFGAKKVGFKRIGIGRTFVHLDNDASKTQYIAWGYPKPPYNPFSKTYYAYM